LGLRDLTLPLGSDYGDDIEEQDEERRRRRQEVITKAYKQLGALTQLRIPSFGSEVPKKNREQFLVGLGGLEGF
jgi:hypothetical protein